MGTYQELFLKMTKAQKCQEEQPDAPWFQGHSGWQDCWRRAGHHLGWPRESPSRANGVLLYVWEYLSLSETLSTSLPGRMLSCPEVYERGFQLGGFNDKQVQFKGEL